METNSITFTNENSINQLLEQIRLSYSHMLKKYLQLYEKFDKLNAEIRDEKLKGRYTQTGQSLFDETGKINWDVIRQFLPSNMEKSIKEEYGLLNENEIRLCCLLFFKVSDRNIAKILIYKLKSIRAIKYIVKHKTGVHDIEEIFRKIIVKNA